MALKWLSVHPAKDGFTRSVREFHLPVSALKNGSGAALIVLKIEQLHIINPRRACAARVTVLGLCVCVSVCLSVCYHVFCHRAQQCAQHDIPAASAGHEQMFKNGVFFKNASFRSYGDICLCG